MKAINPSVPAYHIEVGKSMAAKAPRLGLNFFFLLRGDDKVGEVQVAVFSQRIGHPQILRLVSDERRIPAFKILIAEGPGGLDIKD
jgi:hypothetical protein